MDFDDFGENSTISRFRFSGSARGPHKNSRVNEIFADLWSIGQGQARGHPDEPRFCLKSMRFPGLGSWGSSYGSGSDRSPMAPENRQNNTSI